jgi:hypothetical protein
MSDPDSWKPPAAELSPGAWERRRIGLIRAVVEGVLSVIGVVIALGVAFGIYAALTAPTGGTFEESIRSVQATPHLEEVAAATRLLSVCIGGFVAARRFRGNGFLSAAGVGVSYLLGWALPFTWFVSQLARSFYVTVGLMVPAALLGGAIGRRRA